jgi:hypothetical protein
VVLPVWLKGALDVAADAALDEILLGAQRDASTARIGPRAPKSYNIHKQRNAKEKKTINPRKDRR